MSTTKITTEAGVRGEFGKGIPFDAIPEYIRFLK
jgi:hypothetical protein